MTNGKKYKSFGDFPVWKESLRISTKVFELTKSLPRSEDYGLTSQIRRFANSISANIAEAFGREHLKEKQNFYRYSRGSAYELQSHLIYGNNVNYFTISEVEHFDSEIQKVIHSLNKIIKTLKNYTK